MSDTEPTKGPISYDTSSAILFSNQAQRALAKAADFNIDSDEMLGAAGDDLRAVKSLQKRVEATRTSIIGPLSQASRAINDLFRPSAQFLEQAEGKLKGAMLAYTTEQERKAETSRRMAPAQAHPQAEAVDQAADQVTAQPADHASADAQATAAALSVPVAVPAPARVKGISTSRLMDFEITNLHALVCHVAQHPELTSLLVPDSVKLRAELRATERNAKLPGVRVFEKRSMSARAD